MVPRTGKKDKLAALVATSTPTAHVDQITVGLLPLEPVRESG